MKGGLRIGFSMTIWLKAHPGQSKEGAVDYGGHTETLSRCGALRDSAWQAFAFRARTRVFVWVRAWEIKKGATTGNLAAYRLRPTKAHQNGCPPCGGHPSAEVADSLVSKLVVSDETGASDRCQKYGFRVILLFGSPGNIEKCHRVSRGERGLCAGVVARLRIRPAG